MSIVENPFVIKVDLQARLLELTKTLTPQNVDVAYREATQLLAYTLKQEHISLAAYGLLLIFMGVCLGISTSISNPASYYKRWMAQYTTTVGAILVTTHILSLSQSVMI